MKADFELIPPLLEKLSSHDADFRYMGLNDFMQLLHTAEWNFWNSEWNAKVLPHIQNGVFDKNGEVQNMAVKTLGLMTRKIPKWELEQTLEKLVKKFEESESDRDIACLAIKTMIIEIPNHNKDVARKILFVILPSLFSIKTSFDAWMDILEISNECFSRFGSILPKNPVQTEFYLNQLIQQLKHDRPAVRKRTCQCLGSLSLYLDEFKLKDLYELVCKGVESSDTEEQLIFIQLLSHLCRQVPKKMSKYLSSLISTLLKHLDQSSDEDVKESCFQTLEIICLNDRKEMEPHVPVLTNYCIEYMKYDPNYAYADDEEEVGDYEQMMDEDEVEDEPDFQGDEDDEDYTDDEDMSYKIRKSALKTLSALIQTFPQQIHQFMRSCLQTLLKRFKEREEGVRTEVIKCISTLVEGVGLIHITTDEELKESPVSSPNNFSGGKKRKKRTDKMEQDSQNQNEECFSYLKSQMSPITKQLIQQLKMYPKSQITLQNGFTFMTLLMRTLKVGISDDLFSMFLQVIRHILVEGSNGGLVASSNVQLKMDVFKFLRVHLKYSQTVQSDKKVLNLNEIGKLLLQTLDDKFYKVTTEALKVFLYLIPSLFADSLNQENKQLLEAYLNSLLTLMEDQKSHDIEYSVVECLMQLFYYYQSEETEKNRKVYEKVLFWLQKDSLCKMVLTGVLNWIQSPQTKHTSLNATAIINQVYELIANKRGNRSLQKELLLFISHVINMKTDLPPKSVFEEMKYILNSGTADVQIVSLQILLQLLPQAQCKQDLLNLTTEDIFSRLLSHMLTVPLMNLLLTFFKQWISLYSSDCELLMNSLMKSPLTTEIEMRQKAKLLSVFIAQSNNTSILTQQQNTINPFFLWTIGELFQSGFNSNINPGDLFQSLCQQLKNRQCTESLKNASVFCLASLCFFMRDQLPNLLTFYRQSNQDFYLQYLILLSIRSYLTIHSEKTIDKNLNAKEIWELLFEQLVVKEEAQDGEGVELNTLAECLGLLLKLEPALYKDLIKKRNEQNPHSRALSVAALRFYLQLPKEQESVSLVQLQLEVFMKDDDALGVQFECLALLNTLILHHDLTKVPGLIEICFGIVVERTELNKSLLRVVEMGPFKHTVDDGLDVRKMAYECLYGMIQQKIYFDVRVYELVVKGLQDPASEIQQLSFLMISKLSTTDQSTISIQSLRNWLENNEKKIEEVKNAFKSVIYLKLKDSAVKQELEKHSELMRMAIRALIYLCLHTGLLSPVTKLIEYISNTWAPLEGFSKQVAADYLREWEQSFEEITSTK